MSESLLPPNKTTLEKNLELATNRASEINAPFSTLWNPWACPLAALPWLAWSVGVQEWSTAWGEARKRAVVAGAMNVRRSAGTVSAVRQGLASLGIESLKYSEWHEYGGSPGTYRLTATIENEGFSQQQFDRLFSMLKRVGRLSAWLDIIDFETVARGKHINAATTLSGQLTTIFPQIVHNIEAAGKTKNAMAMQSHITITVYPEVSP